MTDVRGSAITASRNGRKILRNASFFKRIPDRPTSFDDDDWEFDHTTETRSNETAEPVQAEVTAQSEQPEGNTTEATPSLPRRNPDRRARHEKPKRLEGFETDF